MPEVAGGEGGSGILVAPCECRGTQKFVHAGCLSLWRSSIFKSFGYGDLRVMNCTVCKAAFSTPFVRNDAIERSPLVWIRSHFLEPLASVLSVLCALLIRCSVGALFVVLLWIVCICKFPLCTIASSVGLLVVLDFFGLRPVLAEGPELNGFDYRIVFIRFGNPVPGIQHGIVLVALERDRRAGHESVFEKSLVYVLEHGPHGTKGLIVNKSLSSSGKMQERYGGPLRDVPGEPVRRLWHPFGNQVVQTTSVPGLPGIFEGGNDAQILRNCGIGNSHDFAAAQNRAWCAAFTGMACWGPGQLYGEMRAGVWGWLEAGYEAHSLITEAFTLKTNDDLQKLWRKSVSSSALKTAGKVR